MPPPEAKGESACSEGLRAWSCRHLSSHSPTGILGGRTPTAGFWASLPSKGTLTATKLSPGDVPSGGTELRERQLDPDGGGVAATILGGQSPRN